jgi:hypothetical protein
MAKHTIYQIPKSNRQLASRAVYYGISDSFTKSDAITAFAENKYTKVADVEAESAKAAKLIINSDRSKAVTYSVLRNVSIGDIIHNTETNVYFIVGETTFDRIKIKVRIK